MIGLYVLGTLFAVALICVLVFLYWERKKDQLDSKKSFTLHSLQKFDKNPIISPQAHNEWEACGVFNPAAYKDDNDNVHLLYRAIGTDGVSRLGYAQSFDGLSFDERISSPVFFIENPRNIENSMKRFDPVLYPSGGSWGGTEDPRLVRIEDTLYLTFNAFDGWDFIRIGLTSISEKDFISGKWNWKKPVLISPPGEIHKNWVIFPEKINNKFAVLHSVSPNIMIDYRDSLEAIGGKEDHIKSPVGPRSTKRENDWDWLIRGVGCPPIKTEKGWLVLYHAIEKHESDKYKVGVMLLDSKDPTKIIARSPGPLLAPHCWYENDGKPGIVYTCGAIVRDGLLIVYYGGGDMHTCTAQAPLKDVLGWLVSTEK